MPVFSANLMFRTTGHFSVTESHSLKIGRTGLKGMSARVNVAAIPVVGGATLTLNVQYYGSNDGVTYTLIATHPAHVVNRTLGADIITPIVTDYIYVREMLRPGTYAGTNAHVKSGLTTGPLVDWARP